MSTLKQKLKKALLVGGFLLGSAIADLTLNKKEIYAQEPNPVVSHLEDKSTEEKKIKVDELKNIGKQQEDRISLEKLLSPKDEQEFEEEMKKARRIPELKLKLKLDPLLDPYSGADITSSVNKLILKSGDLLLKKINYDTALGRGLKLFFVDFTASCFFDAYQHEEFGHMYRVREQGLDGCSHMSIYHPFIGGKIPFTTFSTRVFAGTHIPTPEYEVPALLAFMGGIEADNIRNNKSAKEIMKKNTFTYYDSLVYLRKGRLFFGFFNYNGPDVSKKVSDETFSDWCGNDAFLYAHTLYNCFSIDVNPSTLRDGSLWIMVDPLLLYSFLNTGFYVGEGIRQMPSPKFMIKGDYNLTPFGPEHYLTFFYRNNKNILTEIYGRKGLGKNYGFGIELINIPFKTKISDNVNIGLDLWSQRFPEKLKEYNGFGVGFNAELEKNIGENIFLNFGMRAKTKGYSLGGKLEDSINGYLGFGINF